MSIEEVMATVHMPDVPQANSKHINTDTSPWYDVQGSVQASVRAIGDSRKQCRRCQA